MLICWNDIKIHLGFEDSYFVPPPTISDVLVILFIFRAPFLVQAKTNLGNP